MAAGASFSSNPMFRLELLLLGVWSDGVLLWWCLPGWVGLIFGGVGLFLVNRELKYPFNNTTSSVPVGIVSFSSFSFHFQQRMPWNFLRAG